MPTVPRGPTPSADLPVPSETDLFMALATMKELGRFSSRLDPALQGRIEDRRGEGPSGALDKDLPDIAEGARSVASDRIAAGVKHGVDPALKEFAKMKSKRASEDSIGVSG